MATGSSAFADFIDVTQESWAKGISILHFLGSSAIHETDRIDPVDPAARLVLCRSAVRGERLRPENSRFKVVGPTHRERGKTLSHSPCFALACAALSICLAPIPAVSQTRTRFSTMPSYDVEDQQVVEFGRLPYKGIFNCSPSRRCGPSDPGFDAEGGLVAEGKVTSFVYRTKGGAGTLAVARNYENAVKAAGGRKLTWREGHEGQNVFLIDQAGSRTWIVLENVFERSYKLTYIDEQPMQQVVTAVQLAESINKQGFATLYINFDTNSAVVKPDARPAIAEIGALLAKDKTLSLSIEGHTDNVGNASANKALSAARAESVLKELVQAKVDAKRLQSRGFGSEMPVADNRLEEGRAKNRRVELVKQK